VVNNDTQKPSKQKCVAFQHRVILIIVMFREIIYNPITYSVCRRSKTLPVKAF